MKTLQLFLLFLASSILVSCTMPDSLPASVTEPAVIATYNKAMSGDGDAMCEIALMYKKGSNGFPQSSTRWRNILMKASHATIPSVDAAGILMVRSLKMRNLDHAKRYADRLEQARQVRKAKGLSTEVRPSVMKAHGYDL